MESTDSPSSHSFNPTSSPSSSFSWDLITALSLETIEKEGRQKVRKQISTNRTYFNNFLADSGLLTLSNTLKAVPTQPQEMSSQIKKKLLSASENAQIRFPYMSTLCRSHETFLIGTAIAMIGFPALRKWSHFIAH
jgi:hypothetical protein